MKEDLFFAPVEISRFRSEAIVFEANDLTNLFEESGHGGRTSERESKGSEGIAT